MKADTMRITKKIKLQQIEILARVYRDAKPALVFANPFELLVAVMLSAQCTDKRVNIVTERLFATANTPEKIAAMSVAELEDAIKDCGLFRMKAKNIKATCQILIDEHGGKVPQDFAVLTKLPGVGRKTANVVLSVGFGVPAIAVDTHVFRVANRLKLGVGKTPDEVEEQLKKIIPREQWSAAHHWLIWHGRGICRAAKPKCSECPLKDVCPAGEKFTTQKPASL